MPFSFIPMFLSAELYHKQDLLQAYGILRVMGSYFKKIRNNLFDGYIEFQKSKIVWMKTNNINNIIFNTQIT